MATSWLWSQADLDGARPYPFLSFAVNLDESVTSPPHPPTFSFLTSCDLGITRGLAAQRVRLGSGVLHLGSGTEYLFSGCEQEAWPWGWRGRINLPVKRYQLLGGGEQKGSRALPHLPGLGVWGGRSLRWQRGPPFLRMLGIQFATLPQGNRSLN